MKKILIGIGVLGALLFAFLTIVYVTGLRTKEYTCTFDRCTITLHTFTNDNSFQSLGYDLALKVVNETGQKQTFKLGNDPFYDVKIESATVVERGVRKEVFIVSTPAGIRYMIDKNTLTGEHCFGIEEQAGVEYHETILMPACAAGK